MSEYQINKIKSAIADCERFIAKEEPREAALRPADAQKHLDFCKAHKVKLENMLVTGVIA